MARKAKKTILVVDDDLDLLETLKAILEDFDYNAITCSGGEAALEKLKAVTPHLILLDIMMPKMDGIQTLAQLKNNPKTSSIPVIMLTAKTETETIWKAQKMGAVDYIVKPFKTDDLLKWVRIYETPDETTT